MTSEPLRRGAKMSASAVIPLIHLHTSDLWPLTLKTFSAVHTYMVNICAKFHGNPSADWREIAWREIGVFKRKLKTHLFNIAYST